MRDVLFVVHVLAAHPAQHAQAHHRVRCERGQVALLLALNRDFFLERLDDARDSEQEEGHPDQHEEAEWEGDLEHKNGDDDERHRRTHRIRDECRNGSEFVPVSRDRGDDIPRCHLLRDVRAAARHLAQQPTHRLPRAVQPQTYLDGFVEAAERSQSDDAERSENPRDDSGVQAGFEAFVKEAADRPRQQRHRHKVEGRKRDGEQEGLPVSPENLSDERLGVTREFHGRAI